MSSSEARGQLDGAKRRVHIESNFETVTANMIAGAHLPAELGGPILDVPFHTFCCDVCLAEHRNDAYVFFKATWFEMDNVGAWLEYKGQALL